MSFVFTCRLATRRCVRERSVQVLPSAWVVADFIILVLYDITCWAWVLKVRWLAVCCETLSAPSVETRRSGVSVCVCLSTTFRNWYLRFRDYMLVQFRICALTTCRLVSDHLCYRTPTAQSNVIQGNRAVLRICLMGQLYLSAFINHIQDQSFLCSTTRRSSPHVLRSSFFGTALSQACAISNRVISAQSVKLWQLLSMHMKGSTGNRASHSSHIQWRFAESWQNLGQNQSC